MENKRTALWWMGGAAASGAACFTQWLDTIKVHMQTQQVRKLSMMRMTYKIIKEQGFLSLNNGLSAAVGRQLTYSTIRFAFYELSKQFIDPEGKGVPFYQKVAIAAVGGAIGGYVGAPFDLINVRMQNDLILKPQDKRNYRNAIHGIWVVYKDEGFKRLFAGSSAAVGRSVLMTVGQLSFYDQAKAVLLDRKWPDNLVTHFTASLFAGWVATTITQPIDVIKTRAMNAKPGEFKTMLHLILYTAKVGPSGFFKGYLMRFVRLAPHTILTFVFLEQLRLNFGYSKPEFIYSIERKK